MHGQHRVTSEKTDSSEREPQDHNTVNFKIIVISRKIVFAGGPTS